MKNYILTIIKALFLSIAFVFILQKANAERKFNFKNISTEQGLPGVSVRKIFQDSKGVLWFCIESVGLCSYDGNTYTQFEYSETDTTSLSNNFATSITEDNEGNIWIGTINGLNVLDPNTNIIKRYYHTKDTTNCIIDNNISDITTDNNGNIWIGTTKGLSIYVSSLKRFFNLLSNDKNNSAEIAKIFKSSNGDVYIGTIQNGFYIYSSGDIAQFSKTTESKQSNLIPLHYTHHYTQAIANNKNIKINRVRSFTEDEDHSVLFSPDYGICRYNPDNQTFHKLDLKDNKYEIVFTDMLLTKNQNLWLTTSANGLFIYNLKTKEITSSIEKPNLFLPFTGYETRDVFQDNSGLIWVTTKFHGVYIYDNRQEEYMHIKIEESDNGISNSHILSLLNTSNDNIWIGCKREGLFLYDPENNKTINKNVYLRKIQSIVKEDDSHLWLGTLTGLAKYSIRTNNYKLYSDSTITAMCKDDEKLWIATYNELKYFDTKKEKFCSHNTKHNELFRNSSFKIMNIVKGRNNDLWIATDENGLYKYFPSNDSLIHYVYNPEDSLSISGNMPRAIYFDSQGTLWVGCKSAGLNKYNEEKDCFLHVLNEPELATSCIYSIMEDEKKNLWIGSHNGIIKYNVINENTEVYSIDYGLQGKVFERNAWCKLNDGEMLLGGQNGFNRFNPNKVHKHNHIAPILISEFKVYDNVIDRNINSFKSYKLPKNCNYININFALLNYNSIGKNQYAYKLEPVEKDWIYSGKRNSATYSQLAGGTYTFSVKGLNGDGNWNKEPISIQFEIKTPLIMKTWFRILIIVLIIFLVSLYIYRKINYAKKNERLFKRLVQDRTRDLQNANEELITKSEQICLQNEELIKHRENLEELVRTRTLDLEYAKEKAEESDRLKSAFLANMSHEIRTPLNAIMGFSSLIATAEFDKEYMKNMNDIIQYNGNSLLQIINDIIDISMIEANQLEIIKKDFELNEVLRELHQNILQQNLLFHKHKDIDIILEIEDSYKSKGIIIHCDKERVKQILTNLIGNAFKFTDSGFIKFGYKVSLINNEIMFFVKDSGIGIEKKNMERIFHRFQKIESQTNILYRGTGLGLSICKNLVSLLDGKISVNSETGIGTQFEFTLPYKEREVLNKSKSA